jgi:RhoGAP domain/PX domain
VSGPCCDTKEKEQEADEQEKEKEKEKEVEVVAAKKKSTSHIVKSSSSSSSSRRRRNTTTRQRHGPINSASMPSTRMTAKLAAQHSWHIDRDVLAAVIAKLSARSCLTTNGLFRVNGSRAMIESVFNGMVAGQCEFGEASAHAIATALKRYLRDSATPLIPFECYEQMILIQQIATPSERLKALRAFVKESLPDDNVALLRLLVPFLYDVAEYADHNRMDLSNLARLFAPSIVRNFPDAVMLDMNAVKSEIALCKELINWFDFLFLGATNVNLRQQDRKWQRVRKRQTMALMQTAECPADFKILDNRKAVSVGKEEDDEQRKDVETDDNEQKAANDEKDDNSDEKDVSAGSSQAPTAVNERYNMLAVASEYKSGSRLLLHNTTTYRVQFGELAVRRTYADFVSLHFFLSRNFAHVAIPELPDRKLARKEPQIVSAALDAFLRVVVSEDELFMDSLFTKRWLQFIGATKPKRSDARMGAGRSAAAALASSSSSTTIEIEESANAGGNAPTKKPRRWSPMTL